MKEKKKDGGVVKIQNNDDEVIVETRKQSDKPVGGKTLSSQKIVGASKKIKKLK